MDETRYTGLERQYSELTNQLGRTISRISKARGERKKELVAKGFDVSKQIEGVLERMDALLLRNDSLRRKYSGTRELKRIAFEEQCRDMAAFSKGTGRVEPDIRQNLLDAERSGRNADSHILNIQRDLEETEDIGRHVGNRLMEQKESLLGTHGATVETSEALGRSNGIIRRLGRSVMTNKCTQALIILIELAILGIIAYIKYIHKDHKE